MIRRCIAWVALVAIVYLLPSATRPDMEERQLASELAELEKEVKIYESRML